jgi:hypothetical protein
MMTLQSLQLLCEWVSSLLKVEAVGSSKMLVPSYQSTQWHIPEDHHFYTAMRTTNLVRWLMKINLKMFIILNWHLKYSNIQWSHSKNMTLGIQIHYNNWLIWLFLHKFILMSSFSSLSCSHTLTHQDTLLVK